MIRMSGRTLDDARRQGGFTMVETITVVGITIALLAVAFVAILLIRVNLLQAELDATAKEIYVAAQNHLALAESQGVFKSADMSFKQNVTGENEGESKNTGNDADAVCYLAWSPDPKPEDQKDQEGSKDQEGNLNRGALDTILPFASIDETVRTGGNYVIRYQPSTGKVLDVFCSMPKANTQVYFTGLDTPLPTTYEACESLQDKYAGLDKAQARRNYNGGKVLGWYGGEGPKETISLEAPTVQVKNGDTLSVKVENPAGNSDKLARYNDGKADDKKATLQMQLIVEGEESGAAMCFELSGDDKINPAQSIVLDDITEPVSAPDNNAPDNNAPDNNHLGAFCFVVENREAEGKLKKEGSDIPTVIPFKPGENLNIYAWVTFKKSVIAPVAKSAVFTTNSLFADGTKVPKPLDGDNDATAEPYIAKVSSFRHLANLSSVSGFDVFNDFKNASMPVQVEQLSDLSWSDFTNLDAAATEDIVDGTRIATKPISFDPVNPRNEISYEGSSHWITGVPIKPSKGDAGLFGTLTTGLSVKNLELIDFDVVSTDGSAGTLLGAAATPAEDDSEDAAKAKTVEISNVLVRQSLESGATAQVTGATAAGGLVGTMNGGSVGKSAAAVYVKATGGPAGGLVGTTSGAVSDSYSGGHTVNGIYNEATGDGEPGRVNVVGTTAGGLIGITSANVTSCYSTCSVSGTAKAGGLVGEIAAGTVSNCYATGKVMGADGVTKGTVAGLGALGNDNKRLEGINPGMNAVGSGAGGSVGDMFANLEVYKDMVTQGRGCVPYDESLARSYDGKYPLLTIAQLDSNAISGASEQGADETSGATEAPMLEAHLQAHYGDWGMPETLIENKRN